MEEGEIISIALAYGKNVKITDLGICTFLTKTYDKYIEGEKTTLWDVYLGDIGVVNTKL